MTVRKKGRSRFALNSTLSQISGPVAANSITEAMIMPSTFGEIFQGEPFDCYIRILSMAQHTYTDVSIKVRWEKNAA